MARSPALVSPASNVSAVVRFVALVLYGFVLVKPLGLPSGPAMISFAAFLFALTLIEPLLLNRS